MRRVIVWMLLVGCAEEGDEPVETTPEEVYALASSQGALDVGYTQAEFSYTALADGGERTIPVEVWYPAAASDAFTATYAVAGIVDNPAPVALDAPPLADGGPFPVLVYSHGSGGVGLLAYPYAELMASHGWIVVAPDHTGNTTLDQLAGTEDSFARIAVDRPADISEVLDALEAGELGVDASAVDTTRSMLFGHSFGAYTTMVSGGGELVDGLFAGECAPDSEDPDCVLLRHPDAMDAMSGGLAEPRFSALSPQAPAFGGGFDVESLAAIDRPILFMSANEDRTTPADTNAKPLWDNTDGADDRWLKLPDGGHYSFISLCDDLEPALIQSFVPFALVDGCGADAVPTAEVVPVMAAYLHAFATEHVLGDDRFAGAFDHGAHPGVNLRGR